MYDNCLYLFYLYSQSLNEIEKNLCNSLNVQINFLPLISSDYDFVGSKFLSQHSDKRLELIENDEEIILIKIFLVSLWINFETL